VLRRRVAGSDGALACSGLEVGLLPTPHLEGSEAYQFLAHFGTNIQNILHETDSFRLQIEFSIHLIEIESFLSGNVSRNEK